MRSYLTFLPAAALAALLACTPVDLRNDDDATEDDDDATADDDDATADDDDATVDDDDDATADDDDATADDDDSTSPETFEVGICNDLETFEDIVELYVAPEDGPELEEILQGAVIEWYGCAFLNLVTGTYSFRIVDEYDFQYAVQDLYLDGYFEYWFSYLDEI